MTETSKGRNNNLIITILAIVGVVAIVGIVIAGISFPGTNTLIGSGNLTSRNYNYTGFTGVVVGGGFRVNILHSDTYSVKVITDDNLIDQVVVTNNAGVLSIGFKTGISVVNPTALRVEITMPAITSVDFSGGTRGTLLGFTNQTSFTATLSGGSDISGTLHDTGLCSFVLSGGSSTTLVGQASGLSVDASGGSTLDLLALQVHNANIAMSGGSNARLNLDGTLDANLSGGSAVRYIGTPTMGNIVLSGGSSVSRIL